MVALNGKPTYLLTVFVQEPEDEDDDSGSGTHLFTLVSEQVPLPLAGETFWVPEIALDAVFLERRSGERERTFEGRARAKLDEFDETNFTSRELVVRKRDFSIHPTSEGLEYEVTLWLKFPDPSPWVRSQDPEGAGKRRGWNEQREWERQKQEEWERERERGARGRRGRAATRDGATA